MTVQHDIERSIAVAELARGNYLLFATESEDQQAKQVFTDMADDMKRHVLILESRRDYLDQHNPLNGGGSPGMQQQGQQEGQQPGQEGLQAGGNGGCGCDSGGGQGQAAGGQGQGVGGQGGGCPS